MSDSEFIRASDLPIRFPALGRSTWNANVATGRLPSRTVGRARVVRVADVVAFLGGAGAPPPRREGTSARESLHWVAWVTDTDGTAFIIDVPGGVLVKTVENHSTEHGDKTSASVALAFVPGASVAAMIGA